MADTSKFKGCFIDESSLYTYDIYMDNDLIAKGHTMSAKDRSAIERNAMTKSFNSKEGEMNIDIDSHALKSHTILQALTSWELPRKLNLENISLLSEPVRDHLFQAIQEHENSLAEIVEDTEKN
jgi:hypothetical protein